METFIQPKITGYRQLTEDEVALMNEGKALAEAVGAFVAKLQSDYPPAHGVKPDQWHSSWSGKPAINQRWVSIGATDLQKGFMALIRSIAQPTTF